MVGLLPLTQPSVLQRNETVCPNATDLGRTIALFVAGLIWRRGADEGLAAAVGSRRIRSGSAEGWRAAGAGPRHAPGVRREGAALAWHRTAGTDAPSPGAWSALRACGPRAERMMT